MTKTTCASFVACRGGPSLKVKVPLFANSLKLEEQSLQWHECHFFFELGSFLAVSYFTYLFLRRPNKNMGVKIEMTSESNSQPSEKLSTIMEPYRKGLRFIKLLGLPMKMKLSKDGNLIFEDHLRLLKCGCASGNTISNIF